MSYLRIKNRGFVEAGAFALLGASTKRDDTTKIGQYGSGNKYSIAGLYRLGIPFKVYSGLNEIKFGTIRQKFSDRNFEVIVIDGERTSITTQTGTEWKLWQMIREFYSNAIDEGDASIEIVDEIKPTADYTSIFIEATSHVMEIIDNFNKYFAFKRTPLGENEDVKIYSKLIGVNLYRKGIEAYEDSESNKTTIFDYDFDKIKINESRLIISNYNARIYMKAYFEKSASASQIQRLFKHCNEGNYWESEFGWSTYDYMEREDEWLEAIDGRVLVPYLFGGFYQHVQNPLHLPSGMITYIRKHLKDKVKYAQHESGIDCIEEEPTQQQRMVYNGAMAFLAEAALKIPYKIVFGRFANADVFGRADIKNEIIYIGLNSLDRGLRETVDTILEEYIHIKYEASDRTTKFQRGSINELIIALSQIANQAI